ncbi:hypothetical protein ACFU99_40620 [Streptomyces sp. NPDC057654]|uniref:hypothetical protein n=1 Tax=Streptomyces sp. NPDC057654 TaxID=3346196 RepID=UPI0036AC6534
MTHAAAPGPCEDRLVWAFLHTFLQYGLLHSAVDGPSGQWFVQVGAGQRIHHLTGAEDAFGFVLDILEIVHDTQGGAR